MASHPSLDRELEPHDLQDLSSADAVAAFFSRLGYRTEGRIAQTGANLGMTAESTLRPIRRIELLANHDELFQVYLFELKSVTVAHTRALARAFLHRAGNYLLVLTSDYETIDFVLKLRSVGWRLLRHGGNHDVWTNADETRTEYIPRHTDINEALARAILKNAEE